MKLTAASEVVAHAWNEWGIQSLVLLSLTLQVTLLILAEFRRRIKSGVLKFSVWSAYLMADATAIYVLGHMSVTSRSPEHQLMAFWAPFLLLHLGGQDNITAYAIEDNRLWLRHLQTLVVQVAAAGYVLYGSSISIITTTDGSRHSGSSPFLGWATILMFAVGAAKYGERVWALKCAGSSPMGQNYRTLQSYSATIQCQYYLDRLISIEGPWDTEAYLLMAHRMLDVPMDLLKGPLGQNTIVYPFASYLGGEDLYKVVEMQLSLMHDMFYTKTVVMHGNVYYLFAHILVAMATAAAFLLFQFHLLLVAQQGGGKRAYNRVDAVVSYILIAGAVVLETVSLLRALFSSWTCPLLVRWSRDKYGREDHTLWNYLARMITTLRRLVHAADWRRSRYWSGSIGQHNLLRLGARSRASSISMIARWMRLQDWWNMLAYSWSIPVSPFVEQLLVKQVLKGEGGGGVSSSSDGVDDHLFDSRGRVELKRLGLYDGDGDDRLSWSLDERILVWHIATNIYLYKMKHKQPLAKAVEALSNYMMFLLAADPYMLSPTASRSTSYIEVCYGLISTTGGPRYSSTEELASVLWRYGEGLLTEETGSMYSLHRDYGFELDFTTQIHLRLILQTGCKLGAKLISSDEAVKLQDSATPGNNLEVMAQVWVETLCYAAHQCYADSHAKQLSNGGELITVAALLVKYLTKKNFPRSGTRFDPRRWNRGGPFGSPLPDGN